MEKLLLGAYLHGVRVPVPVTLANVGSIYGDHPSVTAALCELCYASHSLIFVYTNRCSHLFFNAVCQFVPHFTPQLDLNRSNDLWVNTVLAFFNALVPVVCFLTAAVSYAVVYFKLRAEIRGASKRTSEYFCNR